MWQPVSSQSDADELMKAFGSFHDGCIREVHVWGGYFVDAGLRMTCPDTPDLKCSVFIQRQWESPAAIELLFDGVSQVSLAAPMRYDRIILEATLRVDDGKVFWSPDTNLNESRQEFGVTSAIVANRLWWRPVTHGLGPTRMNARIGELPDGFTL